jgi:energy-coupling factor transport system permease protein
MSSRFEFLGSTVIGQYIPRQSWIHRRDPRARLLAYLALFIGVVFTRDFVGLGIGFVCVLLFYLLAQIPLNPALKGIMRALPFLLILALLQILLGGRTDTDLIITNIFGFGVTQRSVFNASMLLARFALLIVLINGFVTTLSTAQITAAMFYLLKPAEVVRFPVNDLLMVVQITMRYLPLIAQTAEKIAKAQAARGGDWEQRGFNPIRQAKRVLPLIVPLIVNSLKRAETMALAMESRGFNAGEKRSSYYALQFTWMDGVFLLSTTAICGLMIFSISLF